MKRPKLI